MSAAPGANKATFPMKDARPVEDVQPDGLTLSVPIFYLSRILMAH